MRVLVTRPDEDAAPLVATLEERGHEVVSAPLMEVHPLADAVIPDTPYQAVLVTSANGARALGARREMARLVGARVLTVGDASAAVAREAGFGDVESAGGDVVALADLAERRLEPGAGPLLHAAGSINAGDLKSDLERRGFSVDRVALYDTRAAERLPAAAVEFLAGPGGGVLLYSPRSAKIFARLVREAGLDGTLVAFTAYCLSAAVAEALEGLPLAGCKVAEKPNQEALLALLG